MSTLTPAIPEAAALRPQPTPLAIARPSVSSRLFWHIQANRLDFGIAGLLALLTFVTHAWNLSGYPRWFTDEGVYVSQGWAVQYEQQLAPYTYWYDHPPFGWIQLSIWSLLTGGWQRNDNQTIMVGREFMVFMAIASAVLMYVLARRLSFHRPFAVVAVAIWVLSPLAQTFSRYVLLDNIAITWLLAAMVLALSPKRQLKAVVGSALCLTAAALSKETALVIAPAVFYLLWVHFRPADNRWYARLLFVAMSVQGCVFYPLYAVVKNELLPGDGHVSLWQGQILFQLASRTGSGSIFDSSSAARQLIGNAWLGLDPWLPVLGMAAILPALFVRKLRGLALALGAQAVLTLRGGYLPFPFIIGLLPFMALLVAGVAQLLWPSRSSWHIGHLHRLRFIGSVGALVATCLFVTALSPSFNWKDKTVMAYTSPDSSTQLQALNWVAANLPHKSRVVTEGELWPDLRRRGFDRVVWTYKLDSDPAVKASIGGTQGLDYLVLDQSTMSQSADVYPTLAAATTQSTTLATFGPTGPNQISVLKVRHPST